MQFKAINELKKQLMKKKEAANLFGNQKDDSFQGTLISITQTFDGVYLYPSIEEQASHLLYFIIKNHPFQMEIKELALLSLFGFWKKTNTY